MEGCKMELSITQRAIYLSVKQFVLRQQIVQHAMLDIRPDLLEIAETGKLDSALLVKVKHYMSVPQQGLWVGDPEWQYYIHGRGCKLINVITQEPLNWDPPDVLTFDKYWFIDYLRWLGNSNTDTADFIDVIKEITALIEGEQQILQLIEELTTIGLLRIRNPENPNKITV